MFITLPLKHQHKTRQLVTAPLKINIKSVHEIYLCHYESITVLHCANFVLSSTPFNIIHSYHSGTFSIPSDQKNGDRWDRGEEPRSALLYVVRRTQCMFARMGPRHCGLVCMFTIMRAGNGKINRWLPAGSVLHLLTNATYPLCQLIFSSCSTAILKSSREPESSKQASTAVMKLRVNHQSRSTLLSSKRSCRTTRRKSFRLEPDPIKVVSVAGETINAHYKAAAWAAEDFLGPAGEKKQVHLIPIVIEEDNCFLQTRLGDFTVPMAALVRSKTAQ